MSQSAELEIHVGTEVYNMNTWTRKIKQQYGLEFNKKTKILEGQGVLDTIHKDIAQWLGYLGMTRVAFLTQVMAEELESMEYDSARVTIIIYATARD